MLAADIVLAASVPCRSVTWRERGLKSGDERASTGCHCQAGWISVGCRPVWGRCFSGWWPRGGAARWPMSCVCWGLYSQIDCRVARPARAVNQPKNATHDWCHQQRAPQSPSLGQLRGAACWRRPHAIAVLYCRAYTHQVALSNRFPGHRCNEITDLRVLYRTRCLRRRTGARFAFIFSAILYLSRCLWDQRIFFYKKTAPVAMLFWLSCAIYIIMTYRNWHALIRYPVSEQATADIKIDIWCRFGSSFALQFLIFKFPIDFIFLRNYLL